MKTEKTGAAYYYKLWGAVLFIHYALQFCSHQFPEFRGIVVSTFMWFMFPLGGLLSYLRNKRDDATENVVPLFEKVYFFAFIGFALSFGIVSAATVVKSSTLSIALFPLLLGFTVFVVGGITQHMPSRIGGIAGIILTAISLNVNLSFQYLIASCAAFVCSFIPGLLMKNKHV